MGRRVMVYSHDTFGLGNIRRMLTISEHIRETNPAVSLLLVTGSPMVHSFRIRPGLDYIKLPCLSRTGREEYRAKSLGTEIEHIIQLRSNLILSATRDFEPEVVLIDKKPDGVKHELGEALDYLRTELPDTRVALVLRDILDEPQSTIAAWQQRNYHEVLRKFFHAVLVLGCREVFDVCGEYWFPADIQRLTKFCGYLRRPAPAGDVAALRRNLLRNGERHLVLVTTGGGEDGYQLVKTYVEGLRHMPASATVRSLIVCGPEMPREQRDAVAFAATGNPHVSIREFTGDLLSCMAAADVTVSMAGYNTICEILSMGKRAVTVPRVRPVSEQWIRAERLAKRGLLTAIQPDALSPEKLANAVWQELIEERLRPQRSVNLGGLEAVSAWVTEALAKMEAQEAIRIDTQLWSVASPTY